MPSAPDRRAPTFKSPESAYLESAGDRYELVEPLAYGVLADVVLALRKNHHGADSLVVVKRLRTALASERPTAEAFLTEARICMKLRHPNVVQGLALGDDEGRPFLVMELIEGESLAELMTALGDKGLRMPPALAAYLAAEVARGLHYAHELRDVDGKPLGIVHRDVSPQNILLGADGSVKLIDFGIAKTALPREPTAQGVMKGKLAYMAPEQVLGQKVDGRADVFALGILLWEMVTGERLMLGTSMFDTMDRILKGELPKASAHAPHVPAELDVIIAKALAKSPGARFASADEMRLALRGFLRAVAPTVGSDELARLGDTLFAKKRSEDRARREAAVAALRTHSPSGLAPAGRFRPSEPPASDDDPWSQPTARYALVAEDGTTFSQRTTLPTHIPTELLRASLDSIHPSSRPLGDGLRAPLPPTRPNAAVDEEGDVRESGDLPRGAVPVALRESVEQECKSEVFVEPPVLHSASAPRISIVASAPSPRVAATPEAPRAEPSPPKAPAVRAQDLVTPARFGGAGRGSTWLVALASFTLVFCLIAIGAHPRVQVALHALLATVAGTSPAAP